MSNQKHQYKDIGGQAVMEGVMMQSPSDESIAIAVRRPNGRIMVTCKHNEPLSKKHKWMGLPLIRGCVNMVVMLKMGMETLDKSTQMLGVMEEEPSKFEKWLAEKLGASIDKVVMAVAMVLAVALSLFLFVALPSGMATLVGKGTDSRFVINLSAGLTRIAILVGYMIAISFVPDIKRVFMYHGAEHKCINCVEHGLELNVENVLKSSREHKRCGTSFLMYVIVISIIFFMFIRVDSPVLKIVIRLLLIPVIAGVSYEIIRLAGKSDNKLVNLISKPGLMLQHLTTREPDAEMAEVAIAAVEAVFDWRAYLNENFGYTYPAKTEKKEHEEP